MGAIVIHICFSTTSPVRSSSWWFDTGIAWNICWKTQEVALLIPINTGLCFWSYPLVIFTLCYKMVYWCSYIINMRIFAYYIHSGKKKQFAMEHGWKCQLIYLLIARWFPNAMVVYQRGIFVMVYPYERYIPMIFFRWVQTIFIHHKPMKNPDFRMVELTMISSSPCCEMTRRQSK